MRTSSGKVVGTQSITCRCGNRNGTAAARSENPCREAPLEGLVGLACRWTDRRAANTCFWNRGSMWSFRFAILCPNRPTLKSACPAQDGRFRLMG